MKKVCVVCGEKYIINSSSQKTCNEKCRKKWNINYGRARAKKDRIKKRKYSKNRYWTKIRKEDIIKICRVCNKKFKINDNRRVACNKCVKENIKMSSRLWATTHYKPKPRFLIKKCKICNKKIAMVTLQKVCLKCKPVNIKQTNKERQKNTIEINKISYYVKVIKNPFLKKCVQTLINFRVNVNKLQEVRSNDRK